MIGRSLAHYEITRLVGKGGMGEVYLARDGRLGRDVALKILPAEVAGDPERAARFDREARALATLQHPNVASIYGLEEVDGVRFLVMEYVEGRDLSSRLAEGRLPADEVLRIARQLATGLEAAHERGIVHRDLKPANIMLGNTGEAKILDFGLARAWFGDGMGDSGLEFSPTITAAMTQAGTILGTAAYMSPEQARGRHVDRRTDIWAFGVILWEMATGRRLFEGETVSDTLAAVLRAEPQWDLLPVDEAPMLCRLIERCLVRDPQQRLRDIGEARILLQDGGSSVSLLSSSGAHAAGGSVAAPARGRQRLGWIAAAAMAVVAAVLGAMVLSRAPEPRVTQTTLGLPAGESVDLANGSLWSGLAISPDGRSVVYLGGNDRSLFQRDIDAFDAREFPDAQGAQLPVFSPDGRWIAYSAGSKIWKIAVSGGAPVELGEAPVGPGLAWGVGEIYFCRSQGGGLWAIPENGGEPRTISTLNPAREETSHRWPQVLPDGRHLLFTIKTARMETFDEAQIGILSLDTGEVTVLQPRGTNPHYAPSGHIIYGRGSQLFAVPFDLKSLTTRGTPTPALDGVHISEITGSAHFALCPQGDLAYVPTLADMWDFKLAWLSPTGQASDVGVDHGRALQADFSPDGTRFAAAAVAANDKIWIYDPQRGTASRLTNTPGNDRGPTWSADGRWIAYANDLAGPRNLYLVAADGSAPAERILESDTDDFPTGWSPDGSRLMFTRTQADGNLDLWSLSMVGRREAAPYLQSPYNEAGACFSPDGRWVAYMSNVSGEADIYVRPYPGSGNPVRVSVSGGVRPVWSHDGATLYYLSDGRLMAVPIDGRAGLRAGEPREVVTLDKEFTNFNGAPIPEPDGKRFLATRFNMDARQGQIRVLFDWADRLRKLAPSTGG